MKILHTSSYITSFNTKSSFLNRVRSGNESAWYELHDRYVRMISQIGKQHGLSESECEDLMIEVMLIFWKKMHDFIYDPSRGKFRSYLGTIAAFVSMKMFSRKRKNKWTSIPEEYPVYIDSAIMQEWQDYLLTNAMSELRESVDTVTYQAFHMLFIQGCSIEEVAAVTRKTPNNLYGIKYRCIKKLKSIIDEYRQFEDCGLPPHSHSNK